MLTIKKGPAVSDHTGLLVIGVVLLGIVFMFLGSLLLMYLWNTCLVPAVSVLKPVTFFQMVGIDLLLFFLTGRFSNVLSVYNKNK